MPAIYISCDEAYPVFSFYKKPDYLLHKAEVTEEELKLLEEVEENYKKQQNLLDKLFTSSTKIIGVNR